VSVAAGDEATNARTITLQVRDRLKNPWPRRWRVRVRIATTEGGNASGGHAVAFTIGTVTETILIGGEWEVETNSAGAAAFTLTIAGAATRYIHADILGKDRSSAAIGWAA
jgi:hypothetical protein